MARVSFLSGVLAGVLLALGALEVGRRFTAQVDRQIGEQLRYRQQFGL